MITHLSKSYGRTRVLDDVSFDVMKGEIFGLLGPNGAGKTTTCEILEGVRSHDHGDIRILGYRPSDPKLSEHLGVQFQNETVLSRLKVKEVLAFFKGLYGYKPDIGDVIEEYFLKDVASKYCGQLSGGYKKRVLLALAFLGNPSVVFLDEPTAELDVVSQRHIWSKLLKKRSEGVSIFLTSHNLQEVEQLCDRVALISGGKILDIDTPDSLVDKYFRGSVIQFETDRTISPDEIKDGCGYVERIERTDQFYTVKSSDGIEFLRNLYTLLETRNVKMTNLKVEKASLEELFLKLFG